ncbi:hypothetical protein EIK77_010254 [Talaromyces pinophilus]|nr:hypothetical protein EIK77_010254 [Talaromyces pinophilus]
MSPLDDTDVFRSCDFDVHDGVKSVFTFAEDSVRRYSRAQIQRAKDARQRIDQKKEKQEAVENNENTEITISEDLGDGQSAKLDASLKLLSRDELELLIPSDELEDDEIHIIEISTENHALKDYQMQLMLLEQRSKNRLLMARQKQDTFQRAQHLRSSGYARVFEEKPTTKDKIQVSSVQKPSGDLSLKGTLFTLEMPTTRASQRTAPAAKRQKRCHGARDKSHKAADSGVSNGDYSNAQQAGPVEVGDHCHYL